MIKFNNVDFTYQNAQNGAGVHNITLSIPQGQVVLLCGSSGCGKTTLTRMINGLIPHFYEGEMKGDVTVCGMLTADSDFGDKKSEMSLQFWDMGISYAENIKERRQSVIISIIDRSVRMVYQEFHNTAPKSNFCMISNKTASL